MAIRIGNTLQPDQELWQMVVLRALMDALVPGRDDLNKHRAHQWLSGNSKDFKMVCSLAGFEPDFIREAYLNGRVDYLTIANTYSGSFYRTAA